RVLTPRRSLSQPATSFIAFNRQGIHQMPFKTLEFKSRAGINPLLAIESSPGLLSSWRKVLSFVRHWRFINTCTKKAHISYDIFSYIRHCFTPSVAAHRAGAYGACRPAGNDKFQT